MRGLLLDGWVSGLLARAYLVVVDALYHRVGGWRRCCLHLLRIGRVVVRIVDDGDIAVVKGHYLILFPRAACRIKIPCVNRTALLCRLCAVSDLGAS